MHAINYSRFAGACERMGVQLHKNLQVEKKRVFPRPADLNCYTPSAWVGAAAMAGEILRQDPHAVLARERVPEATELRVHSALYAAFARIVNTSLKREEAGTIRCDPAPRAGSCEYAEPYFIKLYDVMSGTSEMPEDNRARPDWTVFRNGDVAVGVRKRKFGVPSVLTFCEWTINGVVYPPGSILSVRYDPRLEGAVQEVGSITGATFLRPSVFAVEPRYRELGFYDGKPPSRPGLMSTTLSDFEKFAQEKLAESRDTASSASGATAA